MFVRNSNSIKRKTISVDDKQKKFLMDNGYSPISKNENGWIYISTNDITSLMKKCEGGDILIE